MVIYADVLVLINSIVDYFLLLLTAKITKINYKWFRIIISAFFGGILSFFILLPEQNIIVRFVYRVFCSCSCVLIAFGYINLKCFLRTVYYNFAVSFIYAGLMIAIWMLIKPSGMLINNSITYFNISPLYLILFSVITYLVITVISSLLKREANCAKRCNIIVLLNDKKIPLNALVDTGNSLTDVLCDSEIIIVSDNIKNKYFTDYINVYPERYRVIPCSTVNGNSVLDGIRTDGAIIKSDKKDEYIKKPTIVFSNQIFKDDYNAIVSPEIFLKSEVAYEKV